MYRAVRSARAGRLHFPPVPGTTQPPKPSYSRAHQLPRAIAEGQKGLGNVGHGRTQRRPSRIRRPFDQAAAMAKAKDPLKKPT